MAFAPQSPAHVQAAREFVRLLGLRRTIRGAKARVVQGNERMAMVRVEQSALLRSIARLPIARAFATPFTDADHKFPLTQLARESAEKMGREGVLSTVMPHEDGRGYNVVFTLYSQKKR